MKKIWFTLLSFILLVLPSSSLAEGTSENLPQVAGVAKFKIGNGEYNINGKVIKDVAPYIKNSRTYLPVRYLAYALGMGDNSIYWDNDLRTAFLKKEGNIVAIKIGENFIISQNKKIETDAPAEITQSRTMLPLRAVSEAFGCEVLWDGTNQVVTIVTFK